MLSTLHGFWTLGLLVVFVGIVFWVFGRRQRRRFDEAARSILDDGDERARQHTAGQGNPVDDEAERGNG